ncbi:MAG TPA: fumarylacetoacetate hydrolase family protein [Burkholderiales bacterium]|nr:fumarylacetoacetate hydrolase family protein [Burkholderiales bacterium]
MLADDLIELHAHPREVPSFSARYPGLTAEAGYAAALALHRHRVGLGWKPLGRKIGFTNRTIWPRYGVYEPMWGMIYDRTVLSASDDAATLPLDGLVQPRIEPEICFGLKAAPDPERPLDAIEWVAHAIEIVQCHHPEWKVSLADCAADNGLHGRLIVGTRIPVAGIPDLAERLPKCAVTLRRGEQLVDRGLGENVLGSPLVALSHLVGVLSRQPSAQPLAAGEIITTGTLTDAHAIRPGETWRTELTGLPLRGLTVHFR